MDVFRGYGLRYLMQWADGKKAQGLAITARKGKKTNGSVTYAVCGKGKSLRWRGAKTNKRDIVPAEPNEGRSSRKRHMSIFKGGRGLGTQHQGRLRCRYY